MVISAAELQLLIVLANARADRNRFAKIERSASDVAQFPGGNQSRIYRSEFVSLNG